MATDFQKVPLNDLQRQYETLREPLAEAVQRVMESGWYSMGSETKLFEEEFADYCGCDYGIAVGNGTDALEIALRGFGCREGDEVVTVANAGMYSATACRHVGASPVFVDIDPDTMVICPKAVAAALTERTKVVVVTHLFGQLVDVAAIRTALAGTQVLILEDCAQSHGAEQDGMKAGSLGDAAAFSFYPTKNLGACGDAGAITSNDGPFAERVRMLRQYGWSQRSFSDLPNGRNSRIDEIQAAILRIKLPLLDRWNEQRRSIVNRYRESTANSRFRLTPDRGRSFVGHLAVVRHPERDKVMRALNRAGVVTGIHYPVLDPDQKALENVPVHVLDLSVTRRAHQEIITLPCFPEMLNDEVDFVCDQLGSLD